MNDGSVGLSRLQAQDLCSDCIQEWRHRAPRRSARTFRSRPTFNSAFTRPTRSSLRRVPQLAPPLKPRTVATSQFRARRPVKALDARVTTFQFLRAPTTFVSALAIQPTRTATTTRLSMDARLASLMMFVRACDCVSRSSRVERQRERES